MSWYWIVLMVIGYCFFGGIVGGIADKIVQENENWVDSFWDTPVPFLASLFWPVAVLLLPFACGVGVSSYFTTASERRKKKADKATIAHERKMAEIKAQEASWKSAAAYLRSEGVKVDVD